MKEILEARLTKPVITCNYMKSAHTDDHLKNPQVMRKDEVKSISGENEARIHFENPAQFRHVQKENKRRSNNATPMSTD